MARKVKLNSENKTKNKENRQLSLFQMLGEKIEMAKTDIDKNKAQDVSDLIKYMLNLDKVANTTWRGLISVPPGSFLEKVIHCFYTRTDIPLEIPFFTSLHYVSAYLLKNNICIKFDDKEIKPDLWSVILAESGSGKTYASKTIGQFIKEKPEFPEISSSAKFIEELEKNNNSFWLRDEFAQLLKNIETNTSMAEMKDYLLRLYDGDTITRSTLKKTITIENPALVILGITVFETFMNNVSMESLADGFAQRFNYVIAKKDKNRSMDKFPLYQIGDYEEKINKLWNDCISNIKHKEYVLSENAIEGFKTSFSLLCTDKIPSSFFRRIMFRGIKYSLIYHVLLNKKSNIIDEEDMGWAGRICAMHIKDSCELLKGHDQSDLQNLLDSAEEYIKRLEAKNMPITARNLTRAMSKLKTTSEARGVLSILGYPS